MRKRAIQFTSAFILSLAGVLLALTFGLSREKADLARLQKALMLQAQGAFSKTAALPSFLASHSTIRGAIDGTLPPQTLETFLSQQLVRTGQFSILLADIDGTIVAAGIRDPDIDFKATKLPAATLVALHAGGLSRQFVVSDDGHQLYQTGLAIQGANATVQGYILVSDTVEDLALNWRALPDRLVLSSQDGTAIFETTPFETGSIPPIRVSSTSVVTGFNLSLERHFSVLLGYAFIGGSIALLSALAAILGFETQRLTRQVHAERIASLSRNAELLEQRVHERTALLHLEIAQRKQAEVALKEKQEQLIQTAKFHVLGDMAAGLSHELSQPLFALQASFGAMEKHFHQTSKQAPKAFHRAKRIAVRMDRILHNLRTFARGETEDPVPVAISTPVNQALEILANAIANAAVDIQHDQPDRPAFCLAGPVRLQQVVINVLSNALDATAKRDVGRIEISYARDNSHCYIRIRDNGPGFSDLEHAAEPFFTTKSSKHGLGLGLSISTEIMESFKGSLTLENASDGGAEITLKLPVFAKEPAHDS